MLEYDTSLLEQRCKRIKKALDGKLTWKWDTRFETVLAVFNTKDLEELKTLLSNEMDIIWQPENMDSAPDLIHIIIDHFGGLNTGQQLFTSDSEIDGILMCAWWPWNDGQKISIRLAVFADSLSDEENEELTRLFRNWFGV